MENHVTINDVASKAEVSISTVSRVLNNLHTGRLEIRERVLQSAEELGYRPSAAARTLAGRGGRSMSFVMQSVLPHGTYFGDVLRGAEDEARLLDYELYFSTSYHNLAVLSAGARPRGISGEAVRGMIYAGGIPDDFFGEVKRAGIPLVHINEYPWGERVDCVMCNNFDASYKAIKWLLALGHRRIACIACNPRVMSIRERLMGYRQALLDADLPFDESLVYEVGGFGPRDGQAAMEGLARLEPRPTAVFGTVDEVAVGAIQAAKGLDLRVPQDLSVLGVNDLEMAQVCDPPLSTVRIFRQEMGRVAVQRLVELIQNPGGVPRRIDVLRELVERASCASPS